MLVPTTENAILAWNRNRLGDIRDQGPAKLGHFILMAYQQEKAIQTGDKMAE